MDHEDCIFCKIIRKEIPSTIKYEDDRVIVFLDIEPVAPVHMLIVPKQHVVSLAATNDLDQDLLGYIQRIAAKMAADTPELINGYRLVTNCGEWAGQSVLHLHYHLVGGKPLTWSF